MASSLITMIVLDGFNVKRKKRWLISENFQVLSNLADTGLRLLNVSSDAEFYFYELKNGAVDNARDKLEGGSDITVLGYNYEIIDKRIDEQHPAAEPAALPDSSPSVSTSTSLPPSSSVNDYCSTPKRRRLDYGAAAKTPSKRDAIGFFFNQNRATILKKFEEYKPAAPMVFKTVDVYEFFAARELGMAAVYVIREKLTEELQDSAVFIITGAIFDLLESISPSLDIPRPQREPLIRMVNELTSSSLFSALSIANGKGTIDTKIKRRRSRLAGKASKLGAQQDGEALEAEILALSSALNAEKNDAGIADMFKSSSYTRYLWVQSLLKKNENDRGIVSAFLAKFPQVKANVGLIHDDYIHFTLTRRSTISCLAEKYRDLVPAIIKLAPTKCNDNATSSLSASQLEFEAGKILGEMISRNAKGNNAEYGRLVIDCSESSEIHNALRKKAQVGITAPAILAVGTFPETTYCIAVDNFPLLVRGTFADALQSFMEVTWMFNLQYDSKVIAIVHFFEVMMGYQKSATTKRQQLLRQLNELKDNKENNAVGPSDIPSSQPVYDPSGIP